MSILLVGIYMGGKLGMSKMLGTYQFRDVARIIMIFGLLIVLAWQAFILYAAPIFWRLFDGDGAENILPWITQLFGSSIVRWLIFISTAVSLIVIIRSKKLPALYGFIILVIMGVITMLMHWSLYAPFTQLIKEMNAQ